MSGKVKNYFYNGNTSKGFYSFYEAILNDCNKIIILKDSCPSVKSKIIEDLALNLINNNFTVELIHSPFDNEVLEGIIIEEFKLALIDNSALINIKYDDLIPEKYIIDLKSTLVSDRLLLHKDKINRIKEKISSNNDLAYEMLAKSIKIHDEWEKIYIENMDFNKANLVTEEFIQRILSNKTLSKESKISHKFFGATTPLGAFDFITNLTSFLNKRYFIKGRPGTGKSTMLRKIAKAAQNKGYDTEIYYCSLDPNSLDMVIIPELDIVIFDSTAPHEYFPERENDEIIDMYAEAVTPKTDETYSEEFKEIIGRYSVTIKEGIQYLLKSKGLNDIIEKIYIESTDFNKVDKIKMELNEYINKSINK